MKASEWRKRGDETARAKAVELELPSGMRILARKPDPVQFAIWNRLPFGLAAASAGADQAAEGKFSAAEAADTAAWFRDLITYCCVLPRVTMTPQSDEEIHPRDIPREDWEFIVRWAQRVEEARELEGFRGKRTDAIDRRDGEGVRNPAVGAVED